MIIKIIQTASNIKQTYDVIGDSFRFQGELGSFSRLQSITLSNKDTTIKGVYTRSKIVNYMPLRYIFGKANLTRAFLLYKNDELYGSFSLSKNGFLKSCYSIALDCGDTFNCYYRSKGSFDYVSVYKGDTQIALIETYLNVNDYKYTHKLYVLDSCSAFADTLALFVLYYASFNFAKRFHVGSDSTITKSWSISRYNDKFDSNWRENNFPDENFFGKTSLLQ